MIPARVIERKRDGARLEDTELEAFLEGYLSGQVPDYQMSALLMAIVLRGLDASETDALVGAMLHSGQVLDLSDVGNARIDKHSTGGVGDKVSLVLAPLAASLGLHVPMMSGRGLGHTTGTLDKLEAIPGFRTDLSLVEFRRVLERVGCAMIGQTREIAPLDRRLYALRDVTGTVASIPLIAASIMSKKLAEGLTGLLLDVKVGSGAFIPEPERALELAGTMVEVGVRRGLPTVALLSAMDRPLGVCVGNALETAEAIRCLRGEGPADLRELVLREAAEMACLADPALNVGEGERRAADALDGGRALERFVRLVEAQGGDARVADEPERLVTAPHRLEVRAADGGAVLEVLPRPLGEAVVAMGGGRVRLGEPIDLSVGFEVRVAPGDEVDAGDLLGVVHAASRESADYGRAVLERSVRVGPPGASADLLPLVVRRVGDAW